MEDRVNEIRKVRNQIRNLLKEHNLHIELGSDVIAGKVFYLCADEEHPIDWDDSIQMYRQNETLY